MNKLHEIANNPEDPQAEKTARLKQIQRGIRDFNLQMYHSQLQQKKRHTMVQKQESFRQKTQLQLDMKRERDERKRRRLSVQQSLFGEYTRHMQSRDKTKQHQRKIEKMYESVEEQESEKYEEARMREVEIVLFQLTRILEADGHHHPVDNQGRVKTEGYERLLRKEISKQLCNYIADQVEMKKEKERLQQLRMQREEQECLEAAMRQMRQQKKLEMDRKRQIKESLKKALEQQISRKNQDGSRYPPIVQYRQHRVSELELKYS